MNTPNDDNLVSSNINVHTLQHIQSSLDINNTDINHTKYDKAYDEDTVKYDEAYDEETVTPDFDEGVGTTEIWLCISKCMARTVLFGTLQGL